MGRIIFIAGKSGQGKSTSLMNFDPQETILINCDKKELPIPKFSKLYNLENRNYAEISELKDIKNMLKFANENKKIKRAVLDTWSRIMDDYIMTDSFRRAPNGMKAWADMAAAIYDLFSFIKMALRPDLKVYLLAHTETFYNDAGLLAEKISTQGKQLEKLIPESFSTVVLYTDVKNIPGKGVQYYFRTKTNGNDTAKSPMGMFEEELIPNDLVIVENKINEYYD